MASGAVVVPASRDLDLPGYWIFGFTLSDEEGQGQRPPSRRSGWPAAIRRSSAEASDQVDPCGACMADTVGASGAGSGSQGKTSTASWAASVTIAGFRLPTGFDKASLAVSCAA